MAYTDKKCDRCGRLCNLPFEHGGPRVVDVYDDTVETKELCSDCMKKLHRFLDGAELNDPGVIENKGQIGFRMKMDPENHLMNRFMRKE